MSCLKQFRQPKQEGSCKERLRVEPRKKRLTMKDLIACSEKRRTEKFVNFYEKYTENLSPDLQLVVAGVRFYVHKHVVCEKSEYFRAMFRCGLQESERAENQPCQEVELHGDTPTAYAFQALLGFFYGGELDFEVRRAEEIVAAATFLVVTSMRKEYAKIVNPKNCKQYAALAEKYNACELKEVTRVLMDSAQRAAKRDSRRTKNWDSGNVRSSPVQVKYVHMHRFAAGLPSALSYIPE